MLKVENEIHHIHMKKKKDEIAETRKQITNYQKMSSFWLALAAKMLGSIQRNVKLGVARLLYEPGGINITDLERIFAKGDFSMFKPIFLVTDIDQVTIYEFINSKKPLIKFKFKAIKEAIYNPLNLYIR